MPEVRLLNINKIIVRQQTGWAPVYIPRDQTICRPGSIILLFRCL